MSQAVALRSPRDYQEPFHRTIDDYPMILQARHVKEILGVSEAFAYEVLNSAKCPTIRMGKRMVVAKESFFRFLQESENQRMW